MFASKWIFTVERSGIALKWLFRDKHTDFWPNTWQIHMLIFFGARPMFTFPADLSRIALIWSSVTYSMMKNIIGFLLGFNFLNGYSIKCKGCLTVSSLRLGSWTTYYSTWWCFRSSLELYDSTYSPFLQSLQLRLWL